MIFLELFKPLGRDVVVYYEAAKMFLSGQSPYYGLLTRTFPYNYPPSSFFLIWPLGFFDLASASIMWNIFSTLAVVLSVIFVAKMAQLSRPHIILSLVFLFTIPFFPVKFNIGNGQINHFILLFSVLGLYFYERKRRNLSAAFLAFAISIKLAPAVFLLYFVIKKDWRQVVRTAIFFFLLLVLPIIIFGWDFQKRYYLEIIWYSFNTAVKDWYYNQSLSGFLSRSFINQTLALAVFYFLSPIVVILTYWRGRRVPSKRALAAVSCLYLLVHPVALQHYFGFAIIPFVLLLSRRAWPALTIAYWLLAFDIKNFAAVPREFNFILSHDFYGVLILWVLALWRDNFGKIIGVIWVLSVTLAYLLMLLCRAKFCF